MYAIVKTGGKQYRVEEGRAITVERLTAEQGAMVELSDVLMIADDGNVTIGTPMIEGARVMAEVEENGRAKKIIVFKYKSKVRTRKKTGHRQHFTRLAVTEILRPGQESKAVKPKRRPAAKAEAEAEAAPVAEAAVAVPAAEVAIEAPVKAPVAAPKRRTRAPAAPVAAKAAAPKPRARTAKPKAEVAATKPRARATKPKAEKPAASKTEKKPSRLRIPRRKRETE